MLHASGFNALIIGSLFAFAAHVQASCVPGQACWPNATQIQAFNQSLGGKLHYTVPYAAPCYLSAAYQQGTQENVYNLTTCSTVQTHYDDNPVQGYTDEPVGLARENLYGACANLQWETCGSAQCLLQSLNPELAPTGTCSLGRLSAIYVDARSVDDVNKTLAFAQAHNIDMTIKNTGSDYLGRSTSANSLALWTHNMNNLQYFASFNASSCPSANRPDVGLMGAGVTAAQAYAYFNNLGFDVVGGAVPSVGLAGGYGQGGGHGAFGPSYGLMVDNAIEFDVLTADGQYLTINECNYPDLFFAMRGGGGSTYAVLINYKFQLHMHQDLQVYAFTATFASQSNVSKSTILRDLVTALATNQTLFSNNKLAGYNFYYPNKIETVQILPATGAMAQFKNITSAYASFLTNYPGLTISLNNYTTYTTYSDFLAFEAPYGWRDTPIGYGESLAGRLIPRSLFSSQSVDTLVTAFLNAMQAVQNPTTLIKPVATQIYATGPASIAGSTSTGVNPAWYGSLWEVVTAAGFVMGSTESFAQSVTQQVHGSMDYLRNITKGGGCYMNEADVLETDWQTAFFGSNYDKLLSIKQKYDPNSFFNCWKCVGWTGVSDQRYNCYDQNPNNSTLAPTIPL